MKPERILRFEVGDRELLERLAAAPLPLGMREEASELDFFREVFFDSAAGDLKTKGATLRMRIRKDGGARLLLDVRERRLEEGSVLRRRIEEQVPHGDATTLFTGDSEPAQMLRALIDVDKLAATFELETVRRQRMASFGEGDDGRIAVAVDLLTIRQGDLAGELQEIEITFPADGGPPVDRVVRAFRDAYGLKLTLADTASRARDLLEDLAADAISHELRASREVAVLAYRNGRIALLENEGRLTLPNGPGSGADAARRTMRRAFGRPSGRIRVLGNGSGLPGRPMLEVWLAEEVAQTPDDVDGAPIWISVDDALARAGSPGLRDARTLAALHVLARSGLQTYAAAEREATPPSEDGGVPTPPPQPLELVLQRLEAADGTAEPSPKDVPPDLLLNMELSRMSFDERMLVIAEDPETPLLERLRFLAMFGTRRDDFFMSRVARFKRELARGDAGRSIDGLTPAEQLDVIAIRAREMTKRAYALLRTLSAELAREGIELLRWDALSEADRKHIEDAYLDALDALITPLAADPTHPFPHLRNLRPALAAIVRLPESRVEHFVAIELPGDLPRFLPLPGGNRFVPLEDVIEAELPRLYPGLELVNAHAFRVTRAATLELEDDAVDMRQAVQEVVARRPFQEVVRLEVERSMPPQMRRDLLRELQFESEESVSTLGEQDIHPVDGLVDLAALSELTDIDAPELKWPPIERAAPFPEDRQLFDMIRERDRLVRFPWESFENSVERFLSEAADDPDVISMKITLYRTARDSAIVEALRRARANGKEAVALVELKASFDEQRNIGWARGLEDAGIHIVYSPAQFKVHAKIAMVVRREEGGVRRYVYIGTGNLNATTAATYIDLGILTADPALTQEVSDLFNLLTGYSADVDCPNLLVAPFNMRRRFLQLLEREVEHARAGRPAGFKAQINGLADRRLIASLYRASRAGVPIEMMVREICALRPGVPGVSENIRVVSLLGRFLQHARIFRFENGGNPEFYIGSADWRPRNMVERIEVITPVRDPSHAAVLDGILDETLNHPDAWEIRSDGSYARGEQVIGGTAEAVVAVG